jgi:protein pelota
MAEYILTLFTSFFRRRCKAGMIVERVDVAKRRIGLTPESSLDLINLFRLVRSGDIVYSKTSRELKKERASGKTDSERVQVILGVEVESKIADPLMRRIRLSGRIVYESRDLDLVGKHHAITVYPGAPLKIESQKNFERLRSFAESYRGRRKSVVICVSLDDEDLAVAEFSGRGVRVTYSKSLPRVDKSIQWGEQELEGFFEEVVEAIKGLPEAGILLIGPRIFAERFLAYLRKREKDLLSRLVGSLSTSIGGEAGIREALKSSVVPEHLKELKPFRDTMEAENFIKVMSSDPERVAIGLDEVYDAWSLGAVGKVLVAESYLWNNLENEKLEKLLEQAERGRLELHVLVDGLEASEKIAGLGGIVALLRYRILLRRG